MITAYFPSTDGTHPSIYGFIATMFTFALDLLEFQRLAPPAFWAGLLERSHPERERRGMPG